MIREIKETKYVCSGYYDDFVRLLETPENVDFEKVSAHNCAMIRENTKINFAELRNKSVENFTLSFYIIKQ